MMAIFFGYVCGPASVLFAQEISGSTFKVGQGGIVQFAGYSTTSNFSIINGGAPIGEGQSTSSNFQLAGGYLYYVDASTPLVQQNWRWYDDHYAEPPGNPYAAENTAPSAIPYDDAIKLRVTVKDNDGNGVTGIKLRLQYSTSTDFSAGLYVGEQGTCSTNVWCYADGAGADNTLIFNTTLSDVSFCADGIGVGCGTHNESGTTTSPYNHFANARTEYEFTIKQTTGIKGQVYFFRLVDNATGVAIPLNTGETYPSLTVDGGTLSFSISGLSSGASTEGVTTDIPTTPSAVSFGSLPLGTPRVAAHRLTVTTNATSGYKIYTYQRQGLLSSSAREIPPVSGTNESPLGWSSGCLATSSGCYGYHAGEDVLEGGSTRFAANDTFARFTSTPTEVAYDAGPVTSESTDIVYKVEVRDGQDAGIYQGSIVYIVTPVF